MSWRTLSLVVLCDGAILKRNSTRRVWASAPEYDSLLQISDKASCEGGGGKRLYRPSRERWGYEREGTVKGSPNHSFFASPSPGLSDSLISPPLAAATRTILLPKDGRSFRPVANREPRPVSTSCCLLSCCSVAARSSRLQLAGCSRRVKVVALQRGLQCRGVIADRAQGSPVREHTDLQILATESDNHLRYSYSS